MNYINPVRLYLSTIVGCRETTRICSADGWWNTFEIDTSFCISVCSSFLAQLCPPHCRQPPCTPRAAPHKGLNLPKRFTNVVVLDSSEKMKSDSHTENKKIAWDLGSDRLNVRFGQTVRPNFYCAVRPKWQNFFHIAFSIFLFCLMTYIWLALSLVFR